MIVLVGAAVIVACCVALAGGLGTVLGYGAHRYQRNLERGKYGPPLSHVRLIESEVTEDDLEGWDGEDELDI